MPLRRIFLTFVGILCALLVASLVLPLLSRGGWSLPPLGAAVFVAVTVAGIGTLLVWLLHRISAAARDEDVQPVTDEHRDFASRMLRGMVAQVQHENAMIAARGGEPVVVRLVPQIPIRTGEPARSWMGGAPSLASAELWPQDHGMRYAFLAQIRCADLPEGLWDHLGPREG